MALVVGTVEVFPIPTCGEGDDGADATRTHFPRERLSIRSATIDVAVVSRCRHAAVTHFAIGARSVGQGISDQHAEAGSEGRDVKLSIRLCDVVNGDTTCTFKPLARHLRDALERPIAGAEIQDGGPVVGEVLGEGA